MPANKKESRIRNQESRKTSASLKKITSRPKKKPDRPKHTVREQPKSTTLSMPVYSLAGNAVGEMNLPEEVFGGKVNKQLLAQAVRVYLNNRKGHFSHTKTRGEVKGSTRKIFKQKGTGRARHGAIRAPIFVGGGIALGPKSRKVMLDLPKKMKNKALISALSQKFSEKEIFGLSGLEKSTGKTKEIAKLFKKLDKKSTLIITGENMENMKRAVRNIPKLELLHADQINAFEIIKHQSLAFTKEAVDKLTVRGKSQASGNENALEGQQKNV